MSSLLLIKLGVRNDWTEPTKSPGARQNNQGLNLMHAKSKRKVDLTCVGIKFTIISWSKCPNKPISKNFSDTSHTLGTSET